MSISTEPSQLRLTSARATALCDDMRSSSMARSMLSRLLPTGLYSSVSTHSRTICSVSSAPSGESMSTVMRSTEVRAR